jgi:hypothetical protein
MTRTEDRYIYIAPNGNGRWRVWGASPEGEYTEECFAKSRKQAERSVSQYAKRLGWKHGSYILSIDE